jgi:putative ABC transport system permease protein
MKFTRFILKNLFRSKLRTSLTIALTAAIFFFVATLISILQNFDQSVSANDSENRLGVQSAVSLANMLPYSYEDRIRQLPGVVDVAKLQWVAAYYKDPRNFFANFAVDADKMASMWPDYHLDPAQLAAFQRDRTCAIVGPGLAKRFGWKIGDRIHLKGTIFPFDPELTIRGIYHHRVDDASLFFHMDYFEKSVESMLHGEIGTFWVKVARREEMPRIAQQIDAMFRNSEDPTETFTEKEFQKQFFSMIGNIRVLFTAVSVCAIFMVILLAAITMSMSARERVTEIAVLRAIGYGRRVILALMLTEFAAIGLAGGVLGGVAANVVYRFIDMTAATSGFLLNFGVSARTLLFCVLCSGAVGIIAGGFPALRAARVPVVDGLRRVV